jgi:formylglycine-generating enzyme required for sulfatase activity
MGGVWEWTSSALERYEGFEPMKLYPVYTSKCASVAYVSLFKELIAVR